MMASTLAAQACSLPYGEWRQVDQRKVVGFTDSLIRMFGVPGTSGFGWAWRGVGRFRCAAGCQAGVGENIPWGLAGRLSRLARGRSL